MLSGMVTRMARDRVPPTSGRLYRNVRTREDWMGRRPGTGIWLTVADLERVMALITFISESKSVYVCRITENTFRVADASVTGWTSYSIEDEDGNPTTFTPNTKFTACQFFNKMYMSDGVNPVWEVDFGHQRVRQIKGSPRGKFIMTFAERIVVANLRLKIGGVRPATYAWSDNADPTSWDGLSAGQEDLGYDNIGDEITHLVALDQGGVIVRRRSMILLTRQPFTQPVFQSRKFADYGCDLPYSVAKTSEGFIFADQATRDVYQFSFSSGFRPLGAAVTWELYEDIDSLDEAHGVFDLYNREYHLGIVTSGDTEISKTWVLSGEHGGWMYDDGFDVSCLGIVVRPGAGIAIDDLPGTIDSLMGTIDDLGEEGGLQTELFKGLPDGKVLRQSYDYDHDYDGTEFDMEFISPDFGSPTSRRTLQKLSVRTLALSGGQYLLDERNEREKWRNLKVDTLDPSERKLNLRIPFRQITGEELYWRVRSSAPRIRFYSWWVQLHQHGVQE